MLTHWNYVFPALTHRHVYIPLSCWIPPHGRHENIYLTVHTNELPSNLWYKMHLGKQKHCWSLFGASPVPAPATSSFSLNTWLQWIRQKQPQDEMRVISVLGFGATYIRDFTVGRYCNLYNAVPLFHYNTVTFPPNPHNRHPHSLPMMASYGVLFVGSNSFIQSLSLPCPYGSGHGTVAVLLPGFAINW